MSAATGDCLVSSLLRAVNEMRDLGSLLCESDDSGEVLEPKLMRSIIILVLKGCATYWICSPILASV